MVSKTPKPMMTRRSASDLKNKRPQRNISPKNLDDSVTGLSWKEERELKKALYASLQDVRRQSRDDAQEDESTNGTGSKDELSASQSRTSLSSLTETKFHDESSCSVDSFNEKETTPQPEVKKAKYHAQRKFAVNTFTPIHSEPVSSGAKGSQILSPSQLKKIHAQRKFATGTSSYASVEIPSKPKLKASPVKLFPVRPKTEDFLTYLCFRGTSVLPPHLDLMNVRKEEVEVNGRSGFTRDSSPASSSSISHQNEDSMDMSEFSVKLQTPSRKAARASASTPETARGFANLGRSKKGSMVSPGSRKRLADSYGVGKSPGKGLSPSKMKVADRLALKRKAMATLSAAKRNSPKKLENAQKLRSSLSDGELLKKKNLHSCKKEFSPKLKKKLNKLEISSMSSLKRKSTSDLCKEQSVSPAKKPKQANQCKAHKTLFKAHPKEDSTKRKFKKLHKEALEMHPKKKLATQPAKKPKKTFKPHRPLTRAATHLKSALKAAKLAANKKLKMLGRSASTKECATLSSIVENKRNNTCEKKEKKKLSLESNKSLDSDASGEIRIKTERFPGNHDVAGMVQCPTYYPSEEQFKDPIVYIQSIQSEAEQYGMCKIVPPCNWKMESRVMEDFRFTAYTQYINKMFHKWSPITEQLEYIKHLYGNESTDEFQVPQIGGVEIDLVKLYELVQKYGGMKGTVGKEKKWQKIADSIKIPKQADRVSKLYAAYCKYLLAYETLSDEENNKLMEEVQAEMRSQEQHRNEAPPTCYRCVYKGKYQLLSTFNRAARNMQTLFGDESPNTVEQTEAAYWKIVEQSDDHVSVQGASLDTSIYGSMFPVRRDNQYARHGWNLHNFVESKGSILHHLGLIAGVTVPTVHIGMLYTSKCLSCNEHNLPTVQYLHEGGGLIWYAVPSHETERLSSVLSKLAPGHVRDKGFCLQQNTLMVPPSKLIENGVSVSRCVQSAQEFVVVFPSVNYSCVSLGYTLSESVHYGTQDWIPEGFQASKSLAQNHDVELFSMDALLVFLARDQTTPDTTLALLLPYLEQVVEREVRERRRLSEIGLRDSERLHDKLTTKHSPKADVLEEIIICDNSNKICYLSMVLNSHENSAFSLEQGLQHLQKKNLKHCKLMYRYSEDELRQLVRDVKNRLRGSNSSSPATASPKRKTRKSVSDLKSSPSSSTSS